jgi:peptidoglycan/xylan/chitin deacetylase (PgdA/CDA1 family)
VLSAWSRSAVLHGAWHSGALALTRPFCVGRLVILRYHSICNDNDTPAYVSSSITLPVSVFDRQMRHLSQHYRCISLDEAVQCLAHLRPLPPRSIVVTFDDGYQDNYQYALPVLVKYRIPATIYLVSSTLTVGRVLWTSRLRQILAVSRVSSLALPELSHTPLPLDNDAARFSSARTLTNTLNVMPDGTRHQWIERIAEALQAAPTPPAQHWFLTLGQIDEMRRNGISFGAHTVTHPNLPGLAADEARFEVEQSRNDLQRLMHTDIVHFSYPNSGALHPHFSDKIVGLVRNAGYHSAVTSQEGSCRPGGDVLLMRRVGINRARSSPARFGTLLETTRLTGTAENAMSLE